MVLTLKKVWPNPEDPKEYATESEALKAVLDEAASHGYPPQKVTITKEVPAANDNEAPPGGDDPEENKVLIKLTKSDLETTEAVTKKLQAAGAGVHSESLAKLAVQVYTNQGGMKGTPLGATCSMTVKRDNRRFTYCLEIPLPPSPEELVKPPRSILEGVMDDGDRLVVLDETTTIEDVKRADGLLTLNEGTISDFPLVPRPKNTPDPDVFITTREGKRYLKRVINDKVTAFLWQNGIDPCKIVDCLHRNTMMAMDFIIGQGCKHGEFEKELGPREGYGLTIPAETWFNWTGERATGSAYRELRECVFSLTSLMVEYTAITRKAIKDGRFVLVQHAEVEKNKTTRKQEIHVTFSAPYSQILHDLATKRVFCKVPRQAWFADNRRNPLTFPIIHQLSQHTARFLYSQEKRNCLVLGTLFKNLQGQTTSYEEYKNKSDWRRKILAPLMRDLYNAVELGALIGYRFEWRDGTGFDERPPRSYEEAENAYLRYWLNLDEAGQPPQIEAIAAEIDKEPRYWGRYGVCSVGMRTVPRMTTKPKTKRKKRAKA